MTGERGVSSVVSTVLLVGIVVLIAIPAGIYALEVADPGSDPSPNVKVANPSMTEDGSVDQQVVSMTHRGGATIDMENAEIVVRLEDGEEARIKNLPTGDPELSDSNIEGDAIISKTYSVSATPLSTDTPDGEWTVDETVSFKIESTGLSSGETVQVTVVHTETNSVLAEETFTVQ